MHLILPVVGLNTWIEIAVDISEYFENQAPARQVETRYTATDITTLLNQILRHESIENRFKQC